MTDVAIASTRRPTVSRAEPLLTTLQVGATWFPEHAGGLDRYYYDLIRALPGAGVACRGLVVGTPRVAVDSGGEVRAYAAVDAPMWARWRGARAAAKAVARETHIDLCVAHFALYGFPLIRALPVPTVVHFHGPWASEGRREGAGRLGTMAKWLIERSVYRRAERFIVLSPAFRDVLCADYRIDPDRVRIIPGGVDVDRYAPASTMTRVEARAQLGWPTDRPIVLAVRRLAARMGLERLIEAIAIARARHPDVLCMIAGRGRLASHLQARVDASGLSANVRLLGYVHDEVLPIVYRAADVSVMPTESLEGFGLSAVESLASGTPVLVTPVGGLPEVVRGLDARLILADATVAALAEGLHAALRRDSSIPSGAACRAYAERTFDWRVIAPRVAAVYAEAAGRLAPDSQTESR